MSPELFHAPGKLTEKMDIWALGCLAIEVGSWDQHKHVWQILTVENDVVNPLFVGDTCVVIFVSPYCKDLRSTILPQMAEDGRSTMSLAFFAHFALQWKCSGASSMMKSIFNYIRYSEIRWYI